MATDISICSNALLMLGQSAISSFSETGDRVTLCANLYPSVRDAVLRSHPWNCATKRVLLSPANPPPAFDFSCRFPKPSDWLRTLQVGKNGCQIDFRSEGRSILANANALPLVYIARVSPVEWDPSLVHVVELAMAAKLAYAVTSSTSMEQLKMQEFKDALKSAKAEDGQDDPPEEFEEGSFVEARFS